MIPREELRIYLIDGATVMSRDREKVGGIISCGEDHFIVEKGIFFPKDYLVRFDEVAVANADEIVLIRTKDELRRLTEDELERATVNAGTAPSPSVAASNVALHNPEAHITGHTSDVLSGENLSAPMSDIQPEDLGLKPIDTVAPRRDVANSPTVKPSDRKYYGAGSGRELPPELAGPRTPPKSRPRP